MFHNIQEASRDGPLDATLFELKTLTRDGQDISPFETQICPFLTDLFHSLSSVNPGVEASRAADASPSMLRFTARLIRYNAKWFSEDLESMLSSILDLCVRTTKTADLEATLEIIETCLVYHHIPILQRCIELIARSYYLGSSRTSLNRLAKKAWHLLRHLLESHLKEQSIMALIDIYSDSRSEDRVEFRQIMGSMNLMRDKLLRSLLRDESASIPIIPLLTGLQLIRVTAETAVLHEEILTLVAFILEIRQLREEMTLDGGWKECLSLIQHCTTNNKISGTKEVDGILDGIFERLLTWTPEKDTGYELAIADLCLTAINRLPDGAVFKVLEYLRCKSAVAPWAPRWEYRYDVLCTKLLPDVSRLPGVRIVAADILVQCFAILDSDEAPGRCAMFVDLMKSEQEPTIQDSLMDSVVACASEGSDRQFTDIVNKLSGIVHGFREIIDFHGRQTALACTNGIIRLFLRAFGTTARQIGRDDCAQRSTFTFEKLINIACAKQGPAEAKVAALRLLFRIRSDAHGRSFLLGRAEGEELVAQFGHALSESGMRSSDHQASRNSTASFPETMLSTTWMTGSTDALPEDVPSGVSNSLISCPQYALSAADEASGSPNKHVLDIALFLKYSVDTFADGADWEAYSYVLVHLGPQLSNHSLYVDSMPQILRLRSLVCHHFQHFSFQGPPVDSTLKKDDVAVCLIQILTVLISYQQHFSRSEKAELVSVFLHGIGAAERTSLSCVHALTICCYELPDAVSVQLENVLLKLSQIVTQNHLAVHVLEFLAGLSREPHLYHNFRDQDFKKVFGVCFKYLVYFRDSAKEGSHPASRATSRSGHAGASVLDVPQYLYALAYHVVTFWYLSLRTSDRETLRQWIIETLGYKDEHGNITRDDQALVTVDMMHRVSLEPLFTERRVRVNKTGDKKDEIEKAWLQGLSIILVVRDGETMERRLALRQASGSTIYRGDLKEMTRLSTDPQALREMIAPLSTNTDAPNFLALTAPPREDHDHPDEIAIHRHLLRSPSGSPQIITSIDDSFERAIQAFDRTSPLDSHKAGIIYIGEGQLLETDILANSMGSPDYNELLRGLGNLVRLKGAEFYPHGLDREFDTDGEHTIVWRNSVTELVFLITTIMPTNMENDPNCDLKKRHVGNSFVNIVFNNSGSDFEFDTFPSAFNYVYIVITPSARTTFLQTRQQIGSTNDRELLYKVQVLSRAGFPDISSAAEAKIISGSALPQYVRNLALNACVFSLVWANKDSGEYPSSWRDRLRQLRGLQAKVRALVGLGIGTEKVMIPL